MAQNGTVASGGSVDIVVASYETLRVYDAGGIVGTLSKLNVAGGWDVVDAIDHRNTGEARGWPGPATFRVAISAGSARYAVGGARYLGGAFDATAQGVASTALEAAQDYNHNSAVLLGDSRLAQLHVDAAGSRLRKFGGNFLAWALRLSGQRLKVERSFATSGQRSDQYLAEANVTAALACKSYWLMIYGVLNDIAQLGDNDYWTTNVRPVVERWTATGRQVILLTETGANGLTTAAQRGAVFKYNRQIRDYARQNRGVVIFDVASIVMQPGSAMTINPAYTTDGTHIDTVAGGYAVGTKFADLLKQIIAPQDGLVHSAGQTFTNGGVQLYDNPLFASTDSAAVGIMTGTKPVGVTSASGPSGSSIVSSVAAGPYGNDWQLDITAGAAGTVTVSVPPTSASYWVRGNTYFGNVEADIVAGHSNFQGLSLHQETNNGTSTLETDDGVVTSAAGALPAGAYSGLTLETELLPIGAGTGGWYTNQIRFYFTAAGSATVKLRRLGIHRVGAPPVWPAGLVAYWDFSEAASGPFIAKQGAEKGASLAAVGGLSKGTDGPFGNALVFNGSSAYLSLPAANLGALNGAITGQVTVIAWVKRSGTGNHFIAGCWQEDDSDPRRQYALFANLPGYGGPDRVCGHISRTGQPSPGFPYSIDFSASQRQISSDAQSGWRCCAMTYDGAQAISYMDGVADDYPSYTAVNGETSVTTTKNPYPFTAGLNQGALSDFTVGACKLLGGMSNFLNGRLGGLAVFNRALTPAEMMYVHRRVIADGAPTLTLDCVGTLGFETPNARGWKSYKSATAVDTGNSITDGAACATSSGQSFVYFMTFDSIPQVLYFPLIAGTGILAQTISKITFEHHNAPSASGSLRVLLRIGTSWYIGNTVFAPGVGGTLTDWTNAVTQQTTAFAPADWSDFTLTPGSTMSIGSVRSAPLPDGLVTAIGFYCPSRSGVVRIRNVKVFA